MFWEAPESHSQINTLLDQPDLTLEQLLDDDDVLQKCRECDERLVKFLLRDDNLDALLQFIVSNDIPSSYEKDRYKYPSLACELLTNDIAAILDALLSPTSMRPPLPTCPDMASGDGCLPIAISATTHYVPTQPGSNSSSMLVGSPNSPVAGGAAALDSSMEVCGSSPASRVSSDLNRSTSSESNPTTDDGDGNAVTIGLSLNDPHQEQPLCTATPIITDRLARLDMLISFLKSDQPSNPLTASFVCRLLVHLATHRSAKVIPYLRAQPALISHVVSHLDTCVVADLLLQLAQQDNGQLHLVFQWFIDEHLIYQLIDCFDAAQSEEMHESAARCLTELLSNLRNYLVNNDPNVGVPNGNSANGSGLPATSPYANLIEGDDKTYKAATQLLDVLESEQTLGLLLDRILQFDCPSSAAIVHAVSYFVAVMDKRKPESSFAGVEGAGICGMLEGFGSGSAGLDFRFSSNLSSSSNSSYGSCNTNASFTSADKQRIASASLNLAKVSLDHLDRLHAVLKQQPSQFYNVMPTTTGLLDPPLGRARLAIVQLICLLVSLDSADELREAVLKQNVVGTLLDLFEKYPLNTFLHQAVKDFLQALFTKAKLIDPISTTTCLSKLSDKGRQVSDQTSNGLDGTSTGEQSTSHGPLLSESEKNADDPPTNCGSVEQIEDTVACRLLRSLLVDNRMIDWLLRLCPLPQQKSEADQENPASAVRLSKVLPKPGYSGHLWQLANIICNAQNGRYSKFINQLLPELGDQCVRRWNDFTTTDLTTINAEQVPEDLTSSANEQGDAGPHLLTHQELCSLFVHQAQSFEGASVLLRSKLPFAVPLFPFQNRDQTETDHSDGGTSLSYRTGLQRLRIVPPTASRFDSQFDRWSNDEDDDEALSDKSKPSLDRRLHKVFTAVDEDDDEDDEDDDAKDDEASADLRTSSGSGEEEDDEDEEDLNSPIQIKQQHSGRPDRSPGVISAVTVRRLGGASPNFRFSSVQSRGRSSPPTVTNQADDNAMDSFDVRSGLADRLNAMEGNQTAEKVVSDSVVDPWKIWAETCNADSSLKSRTTEWANFENGGDPTQSTDVPSSNENHLQFDIAHDGAENKSPTLGSHLHSENQMDTAAPNATTVDDATVEHLNDSTGVKSTKPSSKTAKVCRLL